MASEYKFKAGQMYGAEDINNTMSILTHGGVFNITTPNEICNSISGEGVTGQDGKMEVSIIDGQVHIANGSCIMKDGSTFTIYGDGETLDYTSGVTNYVYIENDAILLKNIAKCSQNSPAGGDIILLAEISPTSSILDKRTFAKSKIEKIGSNVEELITIELNPSNKISNSSWYEETITIPLNEKFNYIYIYAEKTPLSSSERIFLRASDGAKLTLTKITENNYENLWTVSEGSALNLTNLLNAVVKIENRILTIHAMSAYTNVKEYNKLCILCV